MMGNDLCQFVPPVKVISNSPVSSANLETRVSTSDERLVLAALIALISHKVCCSMHQQCNSCPRLGERIHASTISWFARWLRSSGKTNINNPWCHRPPFSVLSHGDLLSSASFAFVCQSSRSQTGPDQIQLSTTYKSIFACHPSRHCLPRFLSCANKNCSLGHLRILLDRAFVPSVPPKV